MRVSFVPAEASLTGLVAFIKDAPEEIIQELRRLDGVTIMGIHYPDYAIWVRYPEARRAVMEVLNSGVNMLRPSA